MRASQLNGCAYCIDMHTKDARAAGETEQRLYLLDAWHEAAHLYNERERAALAWTEAVTQVADGHVPDEVYEKVRAHFTEAELVNLTLAVTVDQQLEPPEHRVSRAGGRISSGHVQAGHGGVIPRRMEIRLLWEQLGGGGYAWFHAVQTNQCPVAGAHAAGGLPVDAQQSDCSGFHRAGLRGRHRQAGSPPSRPRCAANSTSPLPT